MTDGTDLVQDLMDTLRESDDSTRQMRRDGRDLAAYEKDYRIALAKKIAELRADGTPVTITPDLARGDEQVAELRYRRDMAKSEWEADRSNCDRLRNQAWIIERQIDREMR